MTKKIVIISSGQPSANPRAVKEATLLSKHDFDITFIYCPLSAWADAFDKKLFQENSSIKWISVGYHPVKNKVGYYYARLRKKIWEVISRYFPNKFDSNIKSSVLFSQELLKESLKHKADFYIGHNLGSIAAVAKVAKKYKSIAGFDAEDFHRGEFTDGAEQMQKTVKIENKYFPIMDYCTVASPLIGDAYRKIFPAQSFTVINNVFSNNYLKKAKSIEEKKTMDLFWFSQFIGAKRGLETVVLAINDCNDLDIKLHLLGNVSENYKASLLALVNDKTKISFFPATAPEEIFNIAAQYDIGLATEVPETFNREICLTNKIFTYIMSGNCILASNTSSQKKFINAHPAVGFLYNGDEKDQLTNLIRKLYCDRALLESCKQNALALAASEYNWEKESEKLIEEINGLLKNG